MSRTLSSRGDQSRKTSDPSSPFTWIEHGLLPTVTIPEDPRLLLVGEGDVAFERTARGLRMIARAREETDHAASRVRHSYRAVLREQEGSVLLDSITLGPPIGRVVEAFDEPERGVTNAALRAVSPREMIDAIVEVARNEHSILARLIERDPSSWFAKVERLAELQPVIARMDDAEERPRRRGRSRMTTDEVYRAVAELCIAAFANGRQSGFHQLVQDHFGGPNTVPKKTAGDWIYKARREEWLAAAPGRGRTEFLPGPRLLARWDGSE